MRKRHCRECGAEFEAHRSTEWFCSTAHRKEFNNRRALRGADIYDLLMMLRYERETANEKGVWTTLTKLCQHFREQDMVEREGRRSWSPDALQALLEKHGVATFAGVVMERGRGAVPGRRTFKAPPSPEGSPQPSSPRSAEKRASAPTARSRR